MASLYTIITGIYPNILNTDFDLQDDGEGPYISNWSYDSPKPTMEYLLTFEDQAIEKDNLREIANQAYAYLKATDYKVLKAMEGEPLDPEVKISRQQARDAIREYKNFNFIK